MDARFTTAVLVEGISDRRAIEALAERRGYDLEATGVSIVSIGGSKNITRWLEAFGPRRLMFGSDWPVCTLASTYQRWVDTVEVLIGGASADEQARIWGGTAIEAYRLPFTAP